MKLFTILNGKNYEGAEVKSLTLKNAGIDIPVISVGEDGRGRKVGVLPVQLLPENYTKWQQEKEVTILHAAIGLTNNGSPKLIELSQPDSISDIIAVLRTGMGFRGGNSHSGDFEGMEKYEDNTYFQDKWRERAKYEDFPGSVLTTGIIAEGEAGRMGSGEQLVAIIPANTVFRTAYSGRLYGDPDEHYHFYDGQRLYSLTAQEREISDLIPPNQYQIEKQMLLIEAEKAAREAELNKKMEKSPFSKLTFSNGKKNMGMDF